MGSYINEKYKRCLNEMSPIGEDYWWVITKNWALEESRNQIGCLGRSITCLKAKWDSNYGIKTVN